MQVGGAPTSLLSDGRSSFELNLGWNIEKCWALATLDHTITPKSPEFESVVSVLILPATTYVAAKNKIIIRSMYIYTWYARFIRNFNKFRSDEALKTPWGWSDTLDCHMGVTRFDGARWLAASRRLIIFYWNIAICPYSCNYSYILQTNVEINVLNIFYTLWKYLWSVVATLSPLGGAWQHATSCGRNTVHSTGLALQLGHPIHVHIRIRIYAVPCGLWSIHWRWSH